MKHVNMNARALSALLFNIIYRSAYTALFILCLLLLAITPIDHIYQTFANHRIGNVFVVGGVVVVTVLLAIFIYFSRLYTNRTVLASIPKPYIPVEPGEVASRVHRLIERNRQRSAIIAWDSRPRDLRAEQHAHALSGSTSDTDLDTDADADQADQDPSAVPLTTPQKPKTTSTSKQSRHRTSKHQSTIFPVTPAAPPWGPISHPGWSDPSASASASASALPFVPFAAVVAELPHLVEAKAVSLAPPDPAASSSADAAPPDARVVALLQRPLAAGLRSYLARLQALGLALPDDNDGNENENENAEDATEVFLAQYEYARFSGHALTEGEFERLMAAFAALLESMVALDVVAVEEALADINGSASMSMSSSSSVLSSTSGRRSVVSGSSASRVSENRARGRGLGRRLSASTSDSSFRSVIVRSGVGVG